MVTALPTNMSMTMAVKNMHATDAVAVLINVRTNPVALLNYMVDHNEHHAAELDQMADNLAKLGMDTAAKQIKEAVSDFQKGNLRLRLALTTVKEELEELKES